MARDAYEISIWRDVLVNGHYEEAKIAVIGSNTLAASCRAVEPKLVENVNGTNTFTFKMFYFCQDLNLQDLYTTISVTDPALLEEAQHLLLVYHDLEGISAAGYDNPFIPFLTNERKIKVKWKDKWYDLVIKNCQEDSAGKSITYTCSDSYINELAKTGFELTFDDELGNNQGTVEELGAKILEGSDWTVDTSLCDTIQQELEEPVFAIHINANLSAVKDSTGATQTIPSGSTILLYYKQLADIVAGANASGSQTFQFAYAPTYKTDANSQLVNNADSFTTSSALSWTKNNLTVVVNGWTINTGTDVSSQYRAKRLSRNQVIVLDPLTGKYCDLYTKTVGGSAHDIYHFVDVNKDDAITVVNVLANSSNFTDASGWEMANTAFKLYPALGSTDLSVYNAKPYLKVVNTATITNYNSGITSCSSYLPDGLQPGTNYIFRVKAMGDSNGSPSGSYVAGSVITPYLGVYTTTGGVKTFSSAIAIFGSPVSEGNGWYRRSVTINQAVPRAELYNQHIGFFINPSQTVWLEEIQFFKEVVPSSGTGYILPGQLSVTSATATRHNFYDHTLYSTLTDAEGIQYIYQGPSSAAPSGVTPVYNSSYAKIRSISGKQSNRFNLLQTLAEQFECWVRFKINHNANGTLVYNADGTPQKYVYFKKTVGQERNIGFVYGIDLKTIQRTIQSDNIVTKTIVNPNKNKFAKNGFCDISRADNNFSKSNTIYNFDYYISQGLLDGAEVTKDLYQKTSGAIGYYAYLNTYYTNYDNNATKINQLEEEKLKLESYRDLYSAAITSANELITDAKANICTAAGLSSTSSLSSATNYFKSHSASDQVQGYLITWRTAEQSKTTYTTQYNECVSGLTTIENQLYNAQNGLYAQQEAILTSIKNLEYSFYKKYSRFIQEGSWQDDSYIDDNLYYIDAVSLAYRSARPQVSYNISVLRLSALEEFKNKVFYLGDITYIQDRDFFGMELINNIPTPIKEQVIVSQLTSNFDEPEKDSFNVQNYKSAFDDLFQRVTAATQSLKFSEGDYARAAGAISEDGSVKPAALQAAFDNNKDLAMSAMNDAVVQDSNGITLSSLDDSSRKVRINSNGIFISTDGGNSWKNAIRSGGVATESLTAGGINAENISIYQGNAPTFRWDFNGISAYSRNNNNTINPGKFVRYDRFGIYGIELSAASEASQVDWVPTTENDIWNNAKFGLTWKGLFIKNKTSTGMVEVSSENDIQITKNNVVRLKIGNIGTSAAPKYGMVINDANGNPVFNAKDDGTLWLEQMLSVGDGTTSFTKIGYGSTMRAGTTSHEIINANNNFIVYEDGYVKLNGSIEWGTGASPTQILYSQVNITAPAANTSWSSYPATSATGWHRTKGASDIYGSYTYDGGKSWTSLIQITGGQGATGVGISSITRYYLATSASSGVTRQTAGWTTTIQTLTTTNKYLWIYEATLYTNNTTTYTEPSINGMKGDTGDSIHVNGTVATYAALSQIQSPAVGDGYIVEADETHGGLQGVLYIYSSTGTWIYSGQVKGPQGEPGAAGVGVNYFTEYYKITNSNTTAPTFDAAHLNEWSSSFVAPTSENPYLWNGERVAYTNGAVQYQAPGLVGNYSKDGDPGASGRGITGLTEYYKKTSTTDVPTFDATTWSTTPLVPDSTDRYLWNVEVTTYDKAPISETSAPAMIGMYGQKGDPGNNGTNGTNGINGTNGDTIEVVYLYHLSNSPNAPSTPTGPSTEWLTYPVSTTESYPYEYVSSGTKKNGNYQGDWQAPALWAKFGIDGTDANVTMQNTFNALTANGTKPCLAYDPTNTYLFLNATYIQTGAFTVTSNSYEVFYADADAGTVRLAGWTATKDKLYHAKVSGWDGVGMIHANGPSRPSLWQSNTNSPVVFYAGASDNTPHPDSPTDCYFGVLQDGSVYCQAIKATGGSLGGWTIGNILSVTGASGLYRQIGSGDNTYTIGMQSSATSSHIAFFVKQKADMSVDKFYVKNDGTLYAANATINGTIYSGSGTIGGWSIGSDIIRNGSSINNSTVGMRMGSGYTATSLVRSGYSPLRFYAGGDGNIASGTSATNEQHAKFVVTDDGSLYAAAAEIGGKIAATSGSLQNLYITGKLYFGSTTTYYISANYNDSNYYINLPGIKMDNASGAVITKGTIGGCSISDGVLQVGSANITALAVDKLTAGTTNVKIDFNNSGDDTGLRIYKGDTWRDGTLNFLIGGSNIYMSTDLPTSSSSVGTMAVFTMNTRTTYSSTDYFNCGYSLSPGEDNFGAIAGDVWCSSGEFRFTRSPGAPTISKENTGAIVFYNTFARLYMGTYTSATYIGIYAAGTSAIYGKFYGTWHTASSIINDSDRNIKYDIEAFDDRYDTLFDRLQPRQYKMIDGSSGRVHTGFIAQDVLSAINNSGLTSKDFAAYVQYEINTDESDPTEENSSARCGLRYEEFISLNTWQIQRLKSRVASLEAKIAELEAKQ